MRTQSLLQKMFSGMARYQLGCIRYSTTMQVMGQVAPYLLVVFLGTVLEILQPPHTPRPQGWQSLELESVAHPVHNC